MSFGHSLEDAENDPRLTALLGVLRLRGTSCCVFAYVVRHSKCEVMGQQEAQWLWAWRVWSGEQTACLLVSDVPYLSITATLFYSDTHPRLSCEVYTAGRTRSTSLSSSPSAFLEPEERDWPCSSVAGMGC